MRIEIGDWRLETGGWRLEVGDWRLVIGNWFARSRQGCADFRQGCRGYPGFGKGHRALREVAATSVETARALFVQLSRRERTARTARPSTTAANPSTWLHSVQDAASDQDRGVDHGGFDIFVAEEFLDGADIPSTSLRDCFLKAFQDTDDTVHTEFHGKNL
jgi:hypothetical protein